MSRTWEKLQHLYQSFWGEVTPPRGQRFFGEMFLSFFHVRGAEAATKNFKHFCRNFEKISIRVLYKVFLEGAVYFYLKTWLISTFLVLKTAKTGINEHFYHFFLNIFVLHNFAKFFSLFQVGHTHNQKMILTYIPAFRKFGY